MFTFLHHETENGSLEGYVTAHAMEPNCRNWLVGEGVGEADAERVMGRLVSPKVAILKNMYVAEGARGKGQGSQLLEEFLEAAAGQQALDVLLLADTADDQAGSGFDLVGWYVGWGFEIVAQTASGPIMLLHQ